MDDRTQNGHTCRSRTYVSRETGEEPVGNGGEAVSGNAGGLGEASSPKGAGAAENVGWAGGNAKAAQGEKSDLSRAFAEDGALKTHVGGQALIEGIMMRGRYNWAVAVREPDGGIYVEEHDLSSGREKNGWMYWPLVRGCRAMVESLMLGYQALQIAALHAFADDVPEEDEPAEVDAVSQTSAEGSSFACDAGVAAPSSVEEQARTGKNAEVRQIAADDAGARQAAADDAGARQVPAKVDELTDDGASFGKREMALSMALGLVLGVVLFIVAPAFVTNLIVGEYDTNTVLWNVVDGLLRVGVFVFYLWLIGRMSDIKRMFGYHGAEHKTIHCYEHGLPLTPENARSFPRLHVRCGTAFLIMVMLIAIFVYTVTPINGLIAAWGVPDGAPKLALVIVVRILLMPVIAGLSYEITVKWAGSHPNNPLVKVVLWPGMQMQYLTTNEPDDDQIECAIAAMRRVLERERAEAAEKADSGKGVAEKAAPEAA